MFRNHLLNQPSPTRTENGMATFVSTNNNVLDLFSAIGGMRGKDIIPLFSKAFNTDPVLATKVALWARDVRGGAGERQIFRDILKYLEKNDPLITQRVIVRVPDIGRWDDLLVLEQPYAKQLAFNMIGAALERGDGLCAKWMPRQGEKAVELRDYFRVSPKHWRKALVNLSNTVEQQMCAQDWHSIEFDHVPSVAAARYQKAFKRNAGQTYENYVLGLKTGTSKINASAVYPYDVVKSLRHGDERVAQAQWDALPNYVGDASWLPVIDTSGSMFWPESRVASDLFAGDIAFSLGMYMSDKASGPMKDVVCTFNDNAELVVLQGNVRAKYDTIRRMPVGGSTNLHSVFDTLLNFALRKGIAQRDMPEGIMIFSDMQFNHCVTYDDRAIEMIRRKYAAAGYKVPKVVFWQLNARHGSQSPVLSNERGVALVSGFSPAVFKSVVAAKQFNPMSVMMETLSNPRYDF